MNGKILEALGKHAPLTILAGLLLVMIGPTGVKELIDRVFPPPTVAAVDKVSDDLEDWKTRTDRKVEQMLANQRLLINGVHELNETISELSAWSLRMEQRVYELERQKASMPYPTIPGTLRSPAGMQFHPAQSVDRLETDPAGSVAE